MSENRPVSLGERWRRDATRGVDDKRLAAALELLPSVRKPMVRIRPGSLRAEMLSVVPFRAPRISPIALRERCDEKRTRAALRSI